MDTCMNDRYATWPINVIVLDTCWCYSLRNITETIDILLSWISFSSSTANLSVFLVLSNCCMKSINAENSKAVDVKKVSSRKKSHSTTVTDTVFERVLFEKNFLPSFICFCFLVEICCTRRRISCFFCFFAATMFLPRLNCRLCRDASAAIQLIDWEKRDWDWREKRELIDWSISHAKQ